MNASTSIEKPGKTRSHAKGGEFNRELIEPRTFELLTRINTFFTSHRVKSYLVGGLIRDALLGRETADIDLAVRGDACARGKALAAGLDATFVILDEKNGVGRLVLKDTGYEIDLASYTGTIEDDLRRRDFTFNAMALDLNKLVSPSGIVVIVDPFQGQNDLDFGVVRSVSMTSLSDDPVRVLRAVRFATELGFTIREETEKQIRQSSPLLSTVPGERIREELVRLMDVARGGQFLFRLDELGILTALFPELVATRGIEQPAEHHWDVFTHCIMTVTALDYILRQGLWEYPGDWIREAVPWPPACASYFENKVASGTTRRNLLKLAALFHDIAKPQTKGPDKKGRIRFLGHNLLGAEIVTSIMERLRFSTRETKLVASVVQYHLRPTQMGVPPSSRAIYRYFRDTGDAGIDILYLSLADHLATRGPALIPANWQEHTAVVRQVLEEHFRKETLTQPPKLVDGHDLIDIFGMKPGPKLGKVLETIKEMQGAGELTTRHQALEYIHNVLTRRKK